jgi:hypothetical protein
MPPPEPAAYLSSGYCRENDPWFIAGNGTRILSGLFCIRNLQGANILLHDRNLPPRIVSACVTSVTGPNRRKDKKMKCQSDYDSEEQVLVRQADECVEAWWEPGNPSSTDRTPKAEHAEPDVGAAEKEALRRGLLKLNESEGLCLSCPKEGDS